MLTDIDGKFQLRGIPSDAKTVTVSFMGTKTQEVPVRANVVVRLEPEVKSIDEVMVVAFGTAKKSAYTGSAKVVGSEELSKSQVSNVTDALAGVVPGLQITSSNGEPGSSSTVRIRGFSSINAGKAPLFVIDGAPMSPDWDIAMLNPSDVESVSVLKDAASNALYGARGANGVIMITTKKAKRGDTNIMVDTKWGSNSRALRQYDVVTSPAQYYEMHYGSLVNRYRNLGMSANEAWLRANANINGDPGNGGLGYNIWDVPQGQALVGMNGKINPNAKLGNKVNYNGKDYLIMPDNWMDESLRHGFRQEYNVTASGATDVSNFYASLGYLSDEGIVDKSDLKRFTARLKGDYQLRPWAKVGMNMSYSRYGTNRISGRDNGKETSTGNVWATAMQLAPIYPFYVRDGQGNIMYDDNGIMMRDYGNGMNAGMSRAYLSDANPVQDNLLNDRENEGNALTGNIFADFRIYKGLSLNLNGTYSLDETRITYVYNPYYGQFDTTGGTVTKAHARLYSYNLQQILNYTTTLREHHNINLMAGHEYTNDRAYQLSATKSKMFSPDNKELGGAIIDGQSADSWKTTYNNEGYFIRGLYDYDNRYFAQASFRRDASSKFHPDYRWGNFWSLGTAWRISQESWFKPQWVNELKLKFSVGSQGNDDIGDFRYTDMYYINNSGGSIGTSFNTKGNKEITWETNTNVNLGVEFEIFRRLTGSIEFYHRKTTDMLFDVPVAPSLGYESYKMNIGDMWNRGVEIDLNANVIDTKKLQWDVHVNLAYLKNKVTKLHPDVLASESCNTLDGKSYGGYSLGSFWISEDLPIYTWRRKMYAGVYSEDTYALTGDEAYDAKKGGMAMYWQDADVTNDDGDVIDTKRVATTDWTKATYFVTEKSTVPPVYGGFGTTLRFHGFDFSANFTYQIGGYGYDGTYAMFMASPTSDKSGLNFHKDLLNAWTPDNSDSNIPRFQYDDIYTAGASSRFLTKASYLNLQNINLGYTLPANLLGKYGIRNLRIYASAENVFYWSKRRGFDPRQTYTGAANATNYSPVRSVSGGISLTF